MLMMKIRDGVEGGEKDLPLPYTYADNFNQLGL